MKGPTRSDGGLRILYVTQHFPPEVSGNASRVSDMAENMVREGAKVTVIAPHPTFPYGRFPRVWRRKHEQRGGNLTVVRLWGWQPQVEEPGFASRVLYFVSFPLHATLWALLHRSRYDVVIGSTPSVFATLPGLLAGWGKIRIVEVRDLWIDAAVSLGFLRERSAFTRLGRWLERRANRSAALLAVTTEEVKRKLIERHGIEPECIALVPNGVDTGRFAPLAVQRKRQFVYAGNIGPAQDFDTVLRAMAILRVDHPDVKLIIAGDGESKPEVEQLARELGLNGAICFPGLISREDVPLLYAESVAGLAPLKDDPALEYALPTKVYEYMAAGIPFIGMGRGEIEALATASGGGIVSANNPEALAQVMASVLDGRVDASAGRRYVQEEADRGVIARAFLDRLYKLEVGS